MSQRIGLMLVGLAAACASDQSARFSFERTADVSHLVGSVSVLGVARDGQLSVDAWEELGSALSSSFGPARCTSAFSQTLEELQPELASVVLAYTLDHGFTEELLDFLGPAANGDAIVAYTVGEKSKRAVVAAIVYSVREHRSVARMSMTYEDADILRAARTFANRLAREIPDLACAGWSSRVRLDAAHLMAR